MATPPAVYGPLESRYWPKVDQRSDDECWPWIGTRNYKGYGRVWDGCRIRPAAQVAWELANGTPFPDGKMACHSCDNPACVNPAHVWPGTAQDNSSDCVRKGRRDGTHFRKAPRQSCPHCGGELPPKQRAVIYPVARAPYADWTVKRALREYRCAEHGCQRPIPKGSLNAVKRSPGFNPNGGGFAPSPRSDLRVCGRCAGIEGQSA